MSLWTVLLVAAAWSLSRSGFRKYLNKKNWPNSTTRLENQSLFLILIIFIFSRVQGLATRWSGLPGWQMTTVWNRWIVKQRDFNVSQERYSSEAEGVCCEEGSDDYRCWATVTGGWEKRQKKTFHTKLKRKRSFMNRKIFLEIIYYHNYVPILLMPIFKTGSHPPSSRHIQVGDQEDFTWRSSSQQGDGVIWKFKCFSAKWMCLAIDRILQTTTESFDLWPISRNT